MKEHNYYVYILTNPGKTVLYTGMTNDLDARVVQHYQSRGNSESFAGRYHCYNLVYYEHYQYVNDAIAREKEIKGWSRKKKLELIAADNPLFEVLNERILEKWPPDKF